MSLHRALLLFPPLRGFVASPPTRGPLSPLWFCRQPGVIMTSEQNPQHPAPNHPVSSSQHPTFIHPSNMQHASASRGSHRIYYAQLPLKQQTKKALKLLDNLCTSSCSSLLAKFRFCLNLNLSLNNNSKLAHSTGDWLAL